MHRAKTVQLRLKRAVFLALPVTLLISMLQTITVIQAPTASAVLATDGLCKADLGSTATASIKRSGRFCYLVFTSGNNSFRVSEGVSRADLLIIAGGGAGGSGAWGGGGGAGEVVYVNNFAVSALTSVSVVVGAGGAAGPASLDSANNFNRSKPGETSTVGSINANGGGAGASYAWGATPSSLANGSSGGSGGGGTEHETPGQGGASVKLSAGLGNAGGNGNGTSQQAGGGGGGAGGAGGNAQRVTTGNAGNGGAGTSNFSDFALATSTGVNGFYAGGGGGGSAKTTTTEGGAGGTGGGGNGGVRSDAGKNGQPGTANTGSGGGGASYGINGSLPGVGGAGGSGIVIVRFALVISDQLRVNLDASDLSSLPAASTAWKSVTPGSETISNPTATNVTRATLNSVEALQFSQTSTLDYGNSSPTRNTAAAYTVETWVNMSTYRPGSWNIFATKWFTSTGRGQTTASQDWHLAIEGNRLNAYTRTCADVEYTEKTFSTSDQNRWFHIAFTISSEGLLKIYLNGVPSANTRSSCQISTAADSGTGVLLMGDPTLSFQGHMSRFRTYGKALSDEELLRNYNVESQSFGINSYTRNLSINPNSFSSQYQVLATAPTLTTSLNAGTGFETGTGTTSFSSATLSTCTVNPSSGAVTFVLPGTCTISASITADSSFIAASDTETFTITKDDLTLTTSLTPSLKYGSIDTATYSVNKTLGSRLITGSVTYETSTSTACNVNSSTGLVTMSRAAGTCQVRVRLSGDPNYSDTSSVLVSITPAKADTLTVTASAVNLTYTGASQSVPYQYSISGLKFSDTLTAVSYNYSGSPNSGGGASGSANVDQAGVYTITPSEATISNSDSYTAVTYATGTLTVNRAARTITGSSVASVKYGSQDSVTVTTSPASSSDGAVTFAAGESTACTVGSGTGIFTMNQAAGTCLIVPTIAQGANYLAATADSAVSITPARADAITVTSGNASATYTGSTVSVSPSFSVSGLIGSDTATITFRYSGTDNGGGSYELNSTAPTNAGTYAIAPLVSQINSDSYTAVANVVNGVLTINRAERTLAATTYSASTLKYGASANVLSNSITPSSDPIDGAFSYAIGAGCSINASTGVVTATTSSGTCSQTTTIGQGNNYLSATAEPVSFTLSKADTLTVTTANPSALTYTGSPVVVTPSISVSGLVNGDSASNAIFNFSRASTCATGGSCVIGDTGPGGGTVFYVSDTSINAADGISTGGRYLEAAPSSFSKTPIQWCAGGTDPNITLVGASGTAIGTGALNTKIIIGRCTGGAGFEAAGLTLGGKSDWFLPSQGEQIEMFTQRSLVGFGVGQPGADYFYFGSTEGSNLIASAIVPANGVGTQNKEDPISYWPIRAFSPIATAYTESTTAPINAGSYEITTSGLQLSVGRSTENYIAIIYETATLTINKADQSIFSNYGSLEAVLGSNFLIYPFGGSGDGAVYLSVSNGTATGCSATNTFVTAVTSGTCVLTVRKSANENFNEAQASFSITFYFFVPAPAAPVSTRSSEIAVDSVPLWSSTASAAPTIASFSPTSGPVGTVVTITGVGLDGVTSGAIARQSLTAVTGISSTSVTAVIAAGSVSGSILLRNSLGVGRSADIFTVIP